MKGSLNQIGWACFSVPGIVSKVGDILAHPRCLVGPSCSRFGCSLRTLGILADLEPVRYFLMGCSAVRKIWLRNSKVSRQYLAQECGIMDGMHIDQIMAIMGVLDDWFLDVRWESLLNLDTAACRTTRCSKTVMLGIECKQDILVMTI